MGDDRIIATCDECRRPVYEQSNYSMRTEGAALVYGRIGEPSPMPTGRTKGHRIYTCASCVALGLLA